MTILYFNIIMCNSTLLLHLQIHIHVNVPHVYGIEGVVIPVIRVSTLDVNLHALTPEKEGRKVSIILSTYMQTCSENSS